MFLDAEEEARLIALEHMTVTLWTFFSINQASAHGLKAAQVGDFLAKGMGGTVADAAGSREMRALVLAKTRALFDRVQENCRLCDEMGGPPPSGTPFLPDDEPGG